MKNEQIGNDLNNLLKYLDHQMDEINASHEKFKVALSGVLRVTDDTTLLTKLQGDPAELQSYLIQLASKLAESTNQCFENLRGRILSIIDLMSIDRKS